MTDDKNPILQTLFADAEQELHAQAFASQVMSQIDGSKRRAVIGWTCVGLVLILCAWLLATPLQEAVYLLTQFITYPLIGLNDRLLAQILLPVNNIASVLALLLIGLRMARRRLFS